MIKEEYDPKSDPEVIEFKRIIRAVLITALVMILISTVWTIYLSVGRGNIQTSQGSNINYNYSQNEFFNSSYSLAPESPYGPSYDLNMRQQRQTTGHYNGTYSFENDIGENPDEWITIEVGGNIEVISEMGNHSAVVMINDTSDLLFLTITQDNINETKGTIEWWWRVDEASEQAIFSLFGEGDTTFFYFMVQNDKFRYFDGGFHDVGKVAEDNVWYHISLNIECTDSGYKGLSQYRWDVNIDQENFGEFEFSNDLDWVGTIQFGSDSGISTESIQYIDAIGYFFGEGDYPASYSFENDIGGYPNNWVVDSSGGTVEVISVINSHNSVIELFDNTGAGDVSVNNSFTNQTNGVVEFWFMTSDNNSLGDLSLYDNFDQRISITYTAGSLSWFDTGYKFIQKINNDQWYHLRLDFDGIAETYDIRVNNILKNISCAMRNSYIDGIDEIGFSTFFGYAGDWLWIDSVGYSWDEYYNIGDNLIFSDYQIGDNIEPYIMYFNTYEVDTWDFWWSKNDPTIRLLTGTDYFNGWSEIEDGGDGVNCLLNSIVEIIEPAADTIGLERTDFDIDIETERLEIIFGFNMKDISATLNNYVDFRIFSNDSTEILTIYWEGDGNELGYYDGIRNVLESGLTEDYWYWIYLDINYITDNCYIELGEYIYDPWLELDPVGSKQGNVLNNYTVPLRVVDKHGLGEVEILAYADSSTTTFWLDYIGIYVNEISISDEHGRYGLDTTITGEYNYEYDTDKYYYYDYWDFEVNPMVGYTIFGEDVGIYLWKSIFLPIGPPTPQFTPIVAAKDHDGSEQHFNVGDFIYDPGERHQEYIFGGVIWFVFSNIFSFTQVNIYGLNFSDGDDTWSMEFETGYLNPDDSKVWVSGNRFYFSMTTNDDTIEFMEITFKLYDDYWQYGNWVFSVNRSLRWGGRIDQTYLFADFRVNYANDEYNSFQLKNTYQFTNQLLGQDLTIISFGLLISDNDNDFDNTIIGYLEPIVLYWNPGAALDITITNYINIIPGVALISVISLTIWGISKKKVGNMLIIPSIALTSFLAYIADFIPIWILFVMLVSCGTLVYSKWKDLFLVFTSFSTMILAFLHYGGVVDLWLFYGSFMLTMGYTIFVGVKDIKGERAS